MEPSQLRKLINIADATLRLILMKNIISYVFDKKFNKRDLISCLSMLTERGSDADNPNVSCI